MDESAPHMNITEILTPIDELHASVEYAEQRRLAVARVRTRLQDGTDYGTIKIGGRETKPTLFKPGAEKIALGLNWTASFLPDTESLAMLGNPGGIFLYRCLIHDPYVGVIAEGRGACAVAEKPNVNTAVKIAEKRAFIDAILRAAGLSDEFTQDLEDQTAATEPAARAVPAATGEFGADLRALYRATVGVLAEALGANAAAVEKSCQRRFGKAYDDLTLDELQSQIGHMTATLAVQTNKAGG